MNLAAIDAAAVVVVAAALVGAVSLYLSDRRKKNEDNRKLAITAYGQARAAWDQAHLEEVTLPVRREKLQEARRRLVDIGLIRREKTQTKEMSQLLSLLDTDLLKPGEETSLALAQVLWPEVEKQLQNSLKATRLWKRST